ncbi:MAG: carboxypeptidase regulatory-like domain-containing protein [Acidobacteria bacterium]|nr:carboxypeptidase regulatory-like domain-containing protein [Acidobacteriota bacterium]
MGALACDGASRLEGRIRDAEGRPIAGVNVVLRVNGRRDSETQSRDDGTYFIQSLGHAPSNDVSLSITAEQTGYVAYERRLTSGEAAREHSLDIVLVPVHIAPRVTAGPGS